MSGRRPTIRSSRRPTTRTGRRGRGRDLAAAAGLALAAAALYHRALALFWVYDDPPHLRYLVAHAPREYLLDPAAWGAAPVSAFTPLFLLSLDLDLALFGLDPRPFHLHQLVAIGLAAAALFLLLRAWLPPAASALGGALFVLGPAVASSASLLMVRHYFESLALAALAAASYVAALRRGRRAWAALSGGLYLLAMLAKEIAVPLLLFLPLVPEGEPRRRWRYAAPHGAALLLYLLYRGWLREPWVAGYGWAVARGDYAWLALALPRKLAAALAGGASLAGWALLVVLVAAVAVLARRGGLRLAAALAAAALPILPVSAEMQPRFALATWAVLAAAVSFACTRLARREGRRWLAGALAGLALAGAAVAGRRVWRERLAELERMSLENRFFVATAEQDVLSHPASAASTLEELERLHALTGQGAVSGAWFRDDLYLCLGRAAGQRLWEFDPAARAVREVPPAARAARERNCGAVRWEAPLEARFNWPERGLFWQLGPYPAPGYAIVFGAGTERIPVPRRGGYRIGAPEVRLRVRYQDPEGWVTYSPELRLVRGQTELSWKRP